MKLSHLIFGFRHIYISEESTSEILSLILRAGFFAKLCDKGVITVSERDFAKIKKVLDGRCEYTFSQIKGLRGFISKNKSRYGIFLALFIVIVCAFFSYNTIFDIRISGTEKSTEEDVINELKSAGFDVGGSWLSTDLTKVEADLLKNSDKISWISINRRGSVAYVEIIEKKSADISEPEYKYSNVVAQMDCVIESITVKSGYAAVKVGDVVKRGEVLISGIPSTAEGTFCKAEGIVIGRVNERIAVHQDRIQTVETPKPEELCGFALKILNFSVNIFKIYGNSVSECDIIERKADCKLFGKRLPISALRSYRCETISEKIELGDTELAILARDATSKRILSLVGSGELIRARTNGSFTAQGYDMITEIVYLTDVALTVPFEIN